MNLFQFGEIEMLAFILVLIRVSVFFALWPIFGVASVPAVAKIFTSLIISIILFPNIEWRSLSADLGSMVIVTMVLREVMIAMILTFVARTLFYSVNVCGRLVSTTIGLSSAQMFNPSMEMSVNTLEQMQLMFATLIFLTWGGHHIFLTAMSESFQILPLSASFTSLPSVETLSSLAQQVVVVGLKLSGPLIAIIFFMNVALGLVGRAVPQINVLITSFPANIMTGFFILLVTLPAFFMGFKIFVNQTGVNIFSVLKNI